MGAYGSPDLNEQKPKPQPYQPSNYYQSPYQQPQQPPKKESYECPYMQAYIELRNQHMPPISQQKPKEEKHGCLLAFIVVFAIVIGMVLGYAFGYNSAAGNIRPTHTTSYSTYQ